MIKNNFMNNPYEPIYFDNSNTAYFTQNSNYTSFDSSAQGSLTRAKNSDILSKVFVGGLSFDTTEEELKNYFSKYGNIIDHTIIKNPETKHSRGFGFIKYSNEQMVDELMKNRPHYLKNRRLDIKRSIPKKNIEKNKSEVLNDEKIFVSGFGKEITEDKLREYFSKFGNILNINIKPPRDGMDKCFGFITFDDYDSVDKIILSKNHRINSYNLKIEKARYIKKDIKSDNYVQSNSNDNFYGSYNTSSSQEDLFKMINKLIAQGYSIYAPNQQSGPIKTQKEKKYYKPY